MALPRLHPHLIEGITNALLEIFQTGRHADKVVELTLKARSKWGARDRRFFAESVYECVRWWRRLCGVAFPETLNPGAQNKYLDREFLTFGRVQKIWYAWFLIRNEAARHEAEFISLAKKINVDPVAAWNSGGMARVIRESIPDWLDREGITQLGENWPDILSALNLPAKVYLRANRVKTSRENLQKELFKEEIITETVGNNDGHEDALKLSERKNVFITAAFKAGLFEVQDLGSQKIVPFLGVEPGMRVIDACAGGGGKTLHMASLMDNKGKIIALDKNDWRLAPLRQRASRAGCDIIETRVITSTKIVKRLRESADRLLLDVPCTGAGVLRRSPDTKWKLTPDEMTRLLSVQQEILQNYSSMTAPGGIMVYSTCSIFPVENQNQVAAFLNSPAGKNWELEEELNIYPAGDTDLKPPTGGCLFLDSDGFYMARLKKTGHF